MIKVGMVSLGCSKNQVDAERMLSAIKSAGMIIETSPENCDAVIINTCGFIEDAKKESIENILEFAELKREGNIKVIAVTGCLAERYREELADEIPEADVILGIGSNSQIVSAIKTALDGGRVTDFSAKENLSLEGERVLANDGYFAYVKVAEGCDNLCTFCAIPSIRGKFRSRKIENIIEEVKTLAQSGVSEINLVAQDTTRYGEDIYGRLMLPELLEQLVLIEGIHWIRVLYAYPERVTDELIDTIAKHDKIVNYFDIPLQHGSARILKKMLRHDDMDYIDNMIDRIRSKIPDAVIRTTLIAGFPGETEEDFVELCDFVERTKFARLGCFSYSQEEGTPAARLPDQLDEELKQRRAQVIMDIQYPIAEQFGQSMVGKTLEVLTEGYGDDMKMYFGRSFMDAPDVDTKVYFKKDIAPQKGDYLNIKIENCVGYDLTGKVVD